MKNADSNEQIQQVETYPPPPWAKEAHTPSFDEYHKRWRQSIDDHETFWGKLAEEMVWDKNYDSVLEWNRPFAKWFAGGKLNASAQCLDKHKDTQASDKKAIAWIVEPGDRRELSDRQFHEEVTRFASGLKPPGVH